MPKITDEFMDEPFEVDIRDGVAVVHWEGRTGRICMPLRVFRLNVSCGAEALAEYDARSAEIVRLKTGCGAR